MAQENSEPTPKEIRKNKYGTYLAFFVLSIFVWGFISGLAGVITGIIHYDESLLVTGGFLMTPFTILALYIFEGDANSA